MSSFRITAIRGLLFILLLDLSFAQQNTQLSPAQDSAQVVQLLSHTISWYRQVPVEQQLATEPADVTFVQQDRHVASQVVELMFGYARAQAQLQNQQRKSQAAQQQAPPAEQYQRLVQASEKIGQQIQDTQNELDSTKAKLARAPVRERKALAAQVDELESEVNLLKARGETLQTMVQFVSSSTTSGGPALQYQVEELARSVPASLSHPAGATQIEAGTKPEATSATPAVTQKPQPTGIWGRASELIRLSGKSSTLSGEISATHHLRQNCIDLRKPLLDYVRSLMQQGDQLSAAADNATPAQLDQVRQQLDDLAFQFKQASASLVPLSKAIVLLDIYERTLTNWRLTVTEESHQVLTELLIRIAVVIVLIGIVLGIGQIWRKTTFRYVHEARRRYQFLLLRKIVVWIAIAFIIFFSFATQLGSAVTFAGLITAGIAVALQNVIVSIVAYFFLIGKYGVRVGDRVQIAGVTGEVVDLGLVRMHVMEFGGPGELQPTGRIVAFSNSIVFQPTAGVFKQIPGTNFVWHEMKLTLTSETDFRSARERITQAVEAALEGYRKDMEIQQLSMERSLSTSAAQLRPRVRLHYTATGVEATVRYPVDMDKANEMDEHVTREIMAAMEREPRLKLVSAEMPIMKAGA